MLLHPCLVLVELMSSQYSSRKYFHLEFQGGTIDHTKTHCFATQVLRHHAYSPSITHCWSWLSPAEHLLCLGTWKIQSLFPLFEHLAECSPSEWSLLLSIMTSLSSLSLHILWDGNIISELPSPSPLTWNSSKDSKFVQLKIEVHSIGNNTCLVRLNQTTGILVSKSKSKCCTLCRWPLILLLGFLSLSFKNDSKKSATKIVSQGTAKLLNLINTNIHCWLDFG